MLATARIYLEYLLSILLWVFLNPYGFRQMVLQTVGQVVAILRALVKGVAFEEPSLPLRLPFDGWWKVHNGGTTKRTSHSWSSISQRYAYDFTVEGESGRTFRDHPGKPENYFAFGQPVLAAADGVVVEIRDDIPDYKRAGTGWIDWRARDIRGNHVVIRHRPDRYTLYAHLQAGSVCVQVGEAVRAGQMIAKCGHSGHSTEPHLHFQLQDRADFHTAIGLPPCFVGFERRRGGQNGQYVKQGTIQRGDLVWHVGDRGGGVMEMAAFTRPGVGDLVHSIAILLLTALGLVVIALRIIELVAR